MYFVKVYLKTKIGPKKKKNPCLFYQNLRTKNFKNF